MEHCSMTRFKTKHWVTSSTYDPKILFYLNAVFKLSVFFSYKSFVYDASKDSWTRLGNTNYGKYGSRVVASRQRIFALGGGGYTTGLTTFVEEYNPDRNTW